MNRPWMISFLALSLLLLGLLKAQELSSCGLFIKAERPVKFKNFSEAKKGLKGEEEELLELWESMLTGRSAPLSKWMKEKYRLLGLNHLFTPSGFHLSAVLNPLTLLFKSSKSRLILLSVVGLFLLWIPGQFALKRMVLIKGGQQLLDLKKGFIIALLLDVLFGSFQHSPLSFSYSFLFLGIIYSGAKGAALIIWFFLAQMILAYFQGNHISPLLLILSPLLNLGFGLVMPLLFLLAIPLYSWQLSVGLLFLKGLQLLVDTSVWLISLFPAWEVHLGVLTLIALILFRKFRFALLVFSFLCGSLNLDLQREMRMGTYDFYPRGELRKIVHKENEDVAYYSDGKCRRKLIRGMWFENCSPLKIRRSKKKRFKKLSYPSSEHRRSSLRG